ncbi:ATP-binding protein [Methylocaldum gracile subsp. desertum]|uniref:ATP-binding protein n=1 Tax=Methylocaldum sp. GT1BW TaxID=3438964 RepID=UPI003DA14368
MNAREFEHDWTAANQRLLTAEFARLKARLDGHGSDDPAALDNARAAMPAPAAIDHLAERFDLSPFERDLLLLCAGTEMDSELAAVCAAAQGQNSRVYVTFGLALAVLEDAHWSALTPARPLRRWRLIEVDENAGLSAARLKIDERVLHYLAGVNYLDVRLQPLLQPRPPAGTMADSQLRAAEAVLEAFEGRESLPIVQVVGDDASGRQDVAARVASAMGLQLCVLRAGDVPAAVHELDSLAVLWQREAVLLEAALLIDCDREETALGTAVRLAERLGGLVFLSAPEPLAVHRANLRFLVNKPDAREQKRLWEAALGTAAARLNGALEGVAGQFRLGAEAIWNTGAALRATLAASPQPGAELWRACRTLGRTRLDDLAQRLDSAAAWDDLILPEPQKTTLRQIAAHVRHRLKVYEDWGFSGKGARGLGISALFAGESGTGKTMAAEVLANELHLDLYRIDLSSVVSKYIGETEKNLRRVFDAAEDSGAILLFDEADALFGKRSEVKDSHDRYANIEVSYLLQRMEAYRGLAILTTNQKAALDTAFQRRLRFVVQFPFPDAAEREAIWRGIFPAATPTEGLDPAKLARLHVAGGNIRNIALNAAFFAAEAAEPVRMPHLLRAAHAEAAKRERPLTDAETRGWV